MLGKVYKIHPAIGVARLGNHPDAFFVGPEAPGSPGLELQPDGTETPLASYKEAGQVKRQAARFRVFEYEQAADGTLQLQGEVGADVKVEWSVDLVNRKAALDRAVGPAHPRNTDIADRDSLIVRNPQPATITGPSQPGSVLQGGFLGQEVHLGELRTDAQGRLIVLGGRGASMSVPPAWRSPTSPTTIGGATTSPTDRSRQQ
jgi:hypothetical protein